MNEFRDDGDFSIFITGSNSYLLSGELVTKLTGRYIEFEMFPLNFNEYLGMKKFLKEEINQNLVQEFDNYLIEGGFYYATNTDNRINYGPVMENAAYVYARSKNYSVSVGRIGKLECDFILRKNNSDYSYLQVCMTIMNSEEAENREYRPLEAIKDNYPKYVVTRSDPIQHRNGIIHKNMWEMMVNGEEF